MDGSAASLRPFACMPAGCPVLQIDQEFVMNEAHRITVDPELMGGRPCIRGLRIRVKDVLELLASGATQEEILADYPYLEAADISAVLQFAALQSDHPVLRAA
jgi:uncharacterized protein (DUF433 family)